MAEWLRRVIRNHLGSSRAGSNPVQCELLLPPILLDDSESMNPTVINFDNESKINITGKKTAKMIFRFQAAF